MLFTAWADQVALDAALAGGAAGQVLKDAEPAEVLAALRAAAAPAPTPPHGPLAARFSRLGPADRELLELRVIGGLSAEDAATVLGQRPGFRTS